MPYGLWDDEYVRTRRSAEAVTLLCHSHIYAHHLGDRLQSGGKFDSQRVGEPFG